MNTLLINPSDIYYLTGVRSHDPGEILIIMREEGKTEKSGIIFCDLRTSALFDTNVYTIIDDRKKWEIEFQKYQSLVTDPDFLTQSVRAKIEGYGVIFSFSKSPIILKRIIKTGKETQLLRQSQKLNKLVYERIVQEIIPGVTEEAIARRIQILQLELGASGPSFSPIVAFGENSAIPHHSPTSRVLQIGEMVLIDMGLVFEGYCSDMTRVFLFSGTFDGKSIQNHGEKINSLSSSVIYSPSSGRSDSISSQTLDSENQKIIQLLQNITSYIIFWAKPGMKVADIDAKARDILGKYAPYFTHSLGHGVGVDIHEEPFISARSEAILEPGMVITIEPGIYITGKYGARYEEMVLVCETGLELL